MSRNIRPTDDYEEIDEHVVIRLGRSTCNLPESDIEVQSKNSYEKLSSTLEQRCYTSLVYAEATIAEAEHAASACDELM